MNALTTTPPVTVARLLRVVAAEKHPKLALGSIAANHHMTMADLQAILGRHGYPDPARMRAEAARLEDLAESGDRSPGDATAPTEDTAGLGNLSQVAVAEIHPDPNNPREELRDIEDLADSMLEAGLIQPIIARRHEGRLVLVAGHRRLAAAKHLKWSHIPCIIRADMRPDDVLAAMLIENGQRSDLDPIEEARGLNKLKAQLGCSDLELARRIGRSQTVVSSRLALLSLTPEEQDAIRAGVMTISAGARTGRALSGRVRPTAKGKKGGAHLDHHHPLASRAVAACVNAGHSKNTPGRIAGACGKCWEAVIRANEREQLYAQSNDRGRCVLCDTAHDPDAVSA